jgi:RimJ/RimL family protein N-acetyltransferase
MISIQPLPQSRFVEFAEYLDDHLSDNGKGDSGYFQPLSNDISGVPRANADAFREALIASLDARGWRRAWVARTEEDRFVGHIDLRSHSETYASHRCVLGMGVDRGFRRQGLGRALIMHAMEWAATQNELEWIDLQVLSSNQKAMALYRAAGFSEIGTIPRMFRIDGQYLSQSLMTLRLASTDPVGS